MKIYIGIDPGKFGCVCAFQEDYVSCLSFYDYNTEIIDRLCNLKVMYDIAFCAIEKQMVMPKQGAVSALTIGIGYGTYLGALQALSIPFIEIRAQEWQKGLGCPADRKARKLKLVEIACNLAPTAEIRTSNKERTSGRADAYLIAEYARKFKNG